MAGAATLFAEGGWYAGPSGLCPCDSQHSDNCHVRMFTLWLRGLDERVGVPCERLL